MKKRVKERISGLAYILFSMITAYEIVWLVYVGAFLADQPVTERGFAVCVLLLMHGLFFLKRIGLKRICAASVAIAVTGTLLLTVLYSGWAVFSQKGAYRSAASDKEALYGGHKVMAIVPHQDDELNILGGVLEEYVKYGGELYVVFVTNGDYLDLSWTRYREAEVLLTDIGIPKDHIIFLGYGNEWVFYMPHIYNAPSGMVVKSHVGRTETYGMDFHPAYREGRAYTIDNLLEDLESVILEYRPEILFCTDYDDHIDHRATTLLFDKVMGTILKENQDYQPVVYKGYAYSTAWYAPIDFYADNVHSTVDPFDGTDDADTTIYKWEDRVRFPVSAASLSRSLLSSSLYGNFLEYRSQRGFNMAARVINGDKVFWQRYTDSLCTSAEIHVTSGDGTRLNDFMLIDNQELRDAERLPHDGAWIPAEEDMEKTVSVRFREPADLHQIVLYDHPAPDQNITAAELCFDDGTKVEVGPLDPLGGATRIPVGKQQVSSFTLRILSWEGIGAGLTEIEAFSQEHTGFGKVMKLMDTEGNFAYDYWTDREGSASFEIYAYGCSGGVETAALSVSVSNPECEAVFCDGRVQVKCPAGEETVLTVTNEAEGISDSIYVRNPSGLVRGFTRFYQRIEEKQHDAYREKVYDDLLQNPAVNWIAEKLHMLGYCISSRL